MRAVITKTLATLALGSLAGALSVGCENTASDCAKLGTCTGGSGGSGGTGGAGGGGTGGTGGGGTGGTGGETTTSTTTAPPCEALKVRSFGDVADQSLSTLLVTPASEVVIAGSFLGTLKLGVAEVVAPGPEPATYVARSAADLAPSSVRKLDATYLAGAVDANGAFVAVGLQSAAVDFGCSSKSPDASYPVGLFVVKLAPDGMCQSHEVFGATAITTVSVAVTPGGEIALAGGFEGMLALGAGGSTLTSNGGADVFVAKLGTSLAPAWSGSYGGAGEDQARAVAVAGNGKIVVAGDHEGMFDIDGIPLDSGSFAAPFVAAFGTTGSVPWARSFKVEGGPQRVFGVAVDSSVADLPEVVLSGDLTAVTKTELSPKLAVDATVELKTAGHAIFLARLSLDSDGKLLSGKAYESTGKLAVGGTAVDPATGRTLLAGWLDGTITFAEDTGVLTAKGGVRGFMAVFGKDLVHQKSLAFGGKGESRVAAAAFEGGDALVAGSYSGTLDVRGQASVTSKGGDDLFLARLCAE